MTGKTSLHTSAKLAPKAHTWQLLARRSCQVGRRHHFSMSYRSIQCVWLSRGRLTCEPWLICRWLLKWSKSTRPAVTRVQTPMTSRGTFAFDRAMWQCGAPPMMPLWIPTGTSSAAVGLLNTRSLFKDFVTLACFNHFLHEAYIYASFSKMYISCT